MITLERRLLVIAATTTRLNTQMRELVRLRDRVKRAQVVVKALPEACKIQGSTNRPTQYPENDGQSCALLASAKAGGDCVLDYGRVTVVPPPLPNDTAAGQVSAGIAAR
jgi:hypothetical protein